MDQEDEVKSGNWMEAAEEGSATELGGTRGRGGASELDGVEEKGQDWQRTLGMGSRVETNSGQ